MDDYRDASPVVPGDGTASPIPAAHGFGDEEKIRDDTRRAVPSPGPHLPEPAERPLPVPQSLEDSVDKQVFSRATVVSISEVGIFVKDILGQATQRGVELHPDLQQVYEYCMAFAPRRTQQVESQCRHIVTSRIPHDYHAGIVLNLAPESADELIALIPQLAPTSSGSPFAGEQEIEDMIAELDAQKAGDLAS